MRQHTIIQKEAGWELLVMTMIMTMTIAMTWFNDRGSISAIMMVIYIAHITIKIHDILLPIERPLRVYHYERMWPAFKQDIYIIGPIRG